MSFEERNEIIRLGLEAGFMLSTSHGQDSKKLMPVTDADTLVNFAVLLRSPSPSKGCEHDKGHGNFTDGKEWVATTRKDCPFCPAPRNKESEPCPYCQSRTCCLVLTAKPRPKDGEAVKTLLKSKIFPSPGNAYSSSDEIKLPINEYHKVALIMGFARNEVIKELLSTLSHEGLGREDYVRALEKVAECAEEVYENDDFVTEMSEGSKQRDKELGDALSALEKVRGGKYV